MTDRLPPVAEAARQLLDGPARDADLLAAAPELAATVASLREIGWTWCIAHNAIVSADRIECAVSAVWPTPCRLVPLMYQEPQ